MNKKNHEIRIKVTKEQHDTIKKKAEKSFMTINGFMLYLGLNGNVRVEKED